MKRLVGSESHDSLIFLIAEAVQWRLLITTIKYLHLHRSGADIITSIL